MTDIFERKARLLDLKKSISCDTVSEVKDSGDTVRLASIVEESMVDGPGLRLVVFTQGCPHRCRGCHNRSTHSFTGGKEISTDRIISIYRSNPGYRGITLSGGEPFCQSEPLSRLSEKIHSLGGDVVTYTGYTVDDLKVMGKKERSIRMLLKESDLIIDGKFIEEKRCLDIPFAGSLNQRYVSMSVRGNILLELIPERSRALRRIRFSSIDMQ